jgi:CheY-like chemotaxis protein
VVASASLPPVDGQPLLARLKESAELRHVPVLMVLPPGAQEAVQGAVSAGAYDAVISLPDGSGTVAVAEAVARLATFAGRKVRRLLVLGPAPAPDWPDVAVRRAADLAGALGTLAEDDLDAVAVVAGVPVADVTGLLDWLRAHPRHPQLPVVVQQPEPPAGLCALAAALPAHLVPDEDALLDRIALVLHRVAGEPPGVVATENDEVLVGRRVLIVDDDVRNVFALTSALEQRGVEVRYADNGRAAIDALEQDLAVDLVLMDIMMPGMDGNETTAEIRSRPEFADLPIIALTAKAMRGDREKSLAAGASDYITKPVEVEHLLRVLRIWLNR